MTREKKEYRALTISEARGTKAGIPSLRIQGQWFQELGFRIGDPILVKCEDGRLIITLDEALREEKEAERAFMEKENKKLEGKVAAEQKRLHEMYVAERNARYGL